MVPYALGQKVEFIKDMGPKLEEFNFKFSQIIIKNLLLKNYNRFMKLLVKLEIN